MNIEYRLRPVDKSDLWQIWQWHENSSIYIIEIFSSFITYDQFYQEYETSISWKKDYIIEDNENTAVGVVSYWDIDYKNRNCRIDFEITKNDISPNSITKLLINVISYLFNTKNMYKIYSYAFESNKFKHYQDLGFKQDGILRENIFKNGKYNNVSLFSLHQDEFSYQE